MIAIVDYGAGNLTSVKKGIRRLGAGSGDHRRRRRGCTSREDRCPRRRPLRSYHGACIARTEGRHPDSDRPSAVPFLGICLGMQWMFQCSEEAPDIAAWAFFPATATRFPSER